MEAPDLFVKIAMGLGATMGSIVLYFVKRMQGTLDERGKLLSALSSEVAVLKSEMLPREEHNEICSDNWDRIHARFDKLNEELREQRHELNNTLQDVAVKLGVLAALHGRDGK